MISSLKCLLITAGKHCWLVASSMTVAMIMASSSLLANEDLKNCHLNIDSLSGEKAIDYSPLNMGYESAVLLGDLVYLTLFDLDFEGKIRPRFAKTFDIDTANQKITIQLDDSCRWSDGAKITATDMLEGIKLLFSEPDSYVVGREYFAGGKEILAGEADISSLGVALINENSIEISYVGSKDMILQALSRQSYTPKPTHYVKQNNMVWPQSALFPISSGPYKLSSILPEKIQLSQNSHYCRDIPVSLKSIDAYTKKNLSKKQMLNDFISGDIDVIYKMAHRYIKVLEQRQARDDFTLGKLSSNDNQLSFYLFINHLNPILADENVTEAIRLAIDFDLFKSKAMFGENMVRLRSYTPEFSDYSPQKLNFGSTDYATRLQSAQALMMASGYSASNPLTLNLPLREGHFLYPVAQALGGMLKQIYIVPEFVEAATGNEYYQRIDDGEFGASVFIWGSDIADPSDYLRGILAKQIVDDKTHESLLKKLSTSDVVQDTAQRYSILEDVERDLAKIGHIIPLYSINRTWALRKPFKFGDLAVLTARNIYLEGCDDSD